MDTAARFLTVGIIGCLCLIVLQTAFAAPLQAVERQTQRRHSLIVRPDVTAPVMKNQTKAEPREHSKPISLIAPLRPAQSLFEERKNEAADMRGHRG
jgi:hypothetical protein